MAYIYGIKNLIVKGTLQISIKETKGKQMKERPRNDTCNATLIQDQRHFYIFGEKICELQTPSVPAHENEGMPNEISPSCMLKAQLLCSHFYLILPREHHSMRYQPIIERSPNSSSIAANSQPKYACPTVGCLARVLKFCFSHLQRVNRNCMQPSLRLTEPSLLFPF